MCQLNALTNVQYIILPSRNTNKMQLCNRIYYSKDFSRLNMFRAAYRSSSGALNSICSLWFICPYGDRPLPRLSGHFDSIIKLHLVGISTEYSTMHGSMNIKYYITVFLLHHVSAWQWHHQGVQTKLKSTYVIHFNINCTPWRCH
jgi:hypothetical protein